MADDILRIDESDGLAVVTLNRPEAMNALSRDLRRAIVKGFGELKANTGIGVIILTGAGRAFCAGLDLKELGTAGVRDNESAIAGADVVRAISTCGKPVIGAINGFAITGGFELALACDLLVASTAARFADTHARIGVMPGWGLSQKLSRLIGLFRAKELSLTGNYIAAEKAEAWGLVNRVVEPEDLMPTCVALARDILSCDPETMSGYKHLIDEGYAETLATGLDLESKASTAHARALTPEKLASRRAGVQARGREQKN